MSGVNFSDLKARILSAIAMVAIGGVCLWLGEQAFVILVVSAVGLMGWELFKMMVPEAPYGRAEAHGLISAIMVATFTYTLGGWVTIIGLVSGAVLLASRMEKDKAIFALYLSLIMVGGHALILLRDAGITPVMWLILIVVASDVAGYFVGRIIGGPKFWPRFSPKKTWSGTLAGWICAGGVGYGFVTQMGMDMLAVPVSVALAFAGQLGDIAESAIKRRYGVKDASDLIPGHGGVMDRFDALIAVASLALILAKLGLLAGLLG